MHFSRLGLDEGLSQQAVLAIAQDAEGFVWLGTEGGLNRFDGYTFQHVRRNRERTDGLTSYFITALEADAPGTLWIATDAGGVLAHDLRSGRFVRLPPEIGDQTGLESVRTLKLDRRGRVWIGSSAAGLGIYDPKQRTLKRYRHQANDPHSLSSDAIHSLRIDAANGAWVGTEGGLDYIDGELSRTPIRHVLGSAGWRAAGPVPVRALLEDQGGRLWVATDRGLIRIEPRTRRQHMFRADANDPHALPADEVQALLEDSRNRIWVGTSAGLALYDPESQGFITYRHDPTDPASLPDDHIVSLFEDRGGVLWVGTQFAGVAKWNPRSWSFGHRRESAAASGANVITSFAAERSGTLWIGTFGAGLRAIDPQGRARHWRHDPARAGSLSDDRVMALLADREGAVWAGTMGGGLNRILPGARRVLIYRHDPANVRSLAADGVMSLLEDRRGDIWVGTYGGGLSRFQRNRGHFVPGVQGRSDTALGAGGRITTLAEDRNGRIWAGTEGSGLYVLDPLTGAHHHWRHDPSDATSLSADTIYALHIDAQGALWVGTRDGGLDRVLGNSLDPARVKFLNYDESRGLPDNTVYAILSDAQGTLWFSTNHGLASFDPLSGTVRSFHRSHGLQGEEFNFGAAFRSRTGMLYFGGTNGYNAFDPAQLEFNDTPPAVALTGISILNRPLHSASPFPRHDALRLGYRDQVVTFEFAALDFAAPRENRYQYRLDGFDTDWVMAGKRRTATYTGLAGGRYTLRVRAANADGRWSQQEFSLPVHVDAPPWKRAWAYALYAAALALVLWAAWSAHRRKFEREARYRRRLQLQVRIRTQELAQRNAALEDANRRLEEASLTDPLTGLANRRALMQALRERAARHGKERRSLEHADQMVLMVIDLDHFKPINDKYGHEAGDAVLKQVAAILRESVRETDLAVRWGGDEFVVAYGTSDLSEGELLAERLRMRIGQRLFQSGHGTIVRTSCSIGFVSYPFVREAPRLIDLEQALAIADAALIQAKLRRNFWVGWGGTATAAKIPGLCKHLQTDPHAIIRQGCLEVRTCARLPESAAESCFHSQ